MNFSLRLGLGSRLLGIGAERRRYLSMGVSGIIGNCVKDIAPIVRAYREAVPDYAYYYTAEGYPKRAPDGSYANGEAGKID